jgi:glycosyltransferase involved in cell wall biosynthesis
VEVLIEAFGRFSKDRPEYELLIIGDGEERPRLERMARGVGSIRFAGSIPYREVAERMSAAEIFVLPTQTMEGHPRALIEAMAAGCKCIASNVAGNREVLTQSGSASMLFQKDSADDLREKLLAASEFDPTCQLEFARENYSITALFARELALLDDMLTEHTDDRSHQA